jgi:hypothetical protein
MTHVCIKCGLPIEHMAVYVDGRGPICGRGHKDGPEPITAPAGPHIWVVEIWGAGRDPVTYSLVAPRNQRTVKTRYHHVGQLPALELPTDDGEEQSAESQP